MKIVRRKSFLSALLLFLLLTVYQRFIQPEIPVTSQKQTAVQGVATQKQQAQVTRIVDGDTIEVLIEGTKTKIRIIGINTPESVDPRRGVQCFGKEASQFAKETLSGQSVVLEPDASQTNTDKYGRLLRYVWFDEGRIDFGKFMIANGYAHEYTYDVPYAYQGDYKATEQKAKEMKQGLWADEACETESK